MKLIDKIILILLLTLVPISLSAFDFGFFLNNRTVLKYDEGNPIKEVHAEQKNMFTIWMSHQFQEDFYFMIKGHLEIGTEFSRLSKAYEFLPTGDIDTLTIGGKIELEKSLANYFGFKVGRFFYSDFTKELAYTPIDGFQFELGFENVELTVSTGYTGLIYDWSNTMRMSHNDVNLSQDWTKNHTYNSQSVSDGIKTWSAYHGPPRFIGDIEVKAPSLFKGQDLYFSLMGQADLWGLVAKNVSTRGMLEENGVGGSSIHTLYSTLGLKGAITSAVYYNVFASFSTGVYQEYLADTASSTGFSYQPKAIAAGLIGLDVTGLIEKALYSKIGFSFRYASGEDGNDKFYDMKSKGNSNSLFLPMNIKQNNLVFNPLMSNLITLGLSYSFKPFTLTNNKYMQNFILSAAVKSFFRASESAISEDYIMNTTVFDTNTSNHWYVGSELDLVINVLTISDFNIYLTTGVFFPYEAAFISGFNRPRLESELNFSISL